MDPGNTFALLNHKRKHSRKIRFFKVLQVSERFCKVLQGSSMLFKVLQFDNFPGQFDEAYRRRPDAILKGWYSRQWWKWNTKDRVKGLKGHKRNIIQDQAAATEECHCNYRRTNGHFYQTSLKRSLQGQIFELVSFYLFGNQRFMINIVINILPQINYSIGIS